MKKRLAVSFMLICTVVLVSLVTPTCHVLAAAESFVQSFESSQPSYNGNFSVSDTYARTGNNSLKLKYDSNCETQNSFSALFKSESQKLSTDTVYRVYAYLKPASIANKIEFKFYMSSIADKAYNPNVLVKQFDFSLQQLQSMFTTDENGWYKIPVSDGYQPTTENPYMTVYSWTNSACEVYIDDVTFEPAVSYQIEEDLLDADKSYWSFGTSWSKSTGFDSNGNIHVTGGTGTATFAGKTAEQETVKLRVAADINSGWACVAFRNGVTAQSLNESGQNAYYLSSGKAYALVITPDTIKVNTCYDVNKQIALSSAYNINLSDGKDHIIEIRTKDDYSLATTEIVILVDGIEAIRCTDKTYAVMPAGYVSVSCCNTDSCVDIKGFEIEGVKLADYSNPDPDRDAALKVISAIGQLPANISFYNRTAYLNMYDVYSTLSETSKSMVTNAQILLNGYNLAIKYGDANNDSIKNIGDLVHFKKMTAGVVANADGLSYADFNSDGKLDSEDMTVMKKLLLGVYSDEGYYDLNNCINPYWKGNTVYREAISFECNSDGTIDGASLMYTPRQIIMVQSVDLGKSYTQSVDFTVSGNKIYLTPDSGITAAPYDIQYPKYADGVSADWLAMSDDPTRYAAVRSMRDYQVFVTYTHDDDWSGETPQAQLSKLPLTAQKLKNGEPLKIVFYGDSITAGYEASGQSEYAVNMATCERTMFVRNLSPYLPSWATLVKQGLEANFPGSSITKVNLGAPSSASSWGVKNSAMLNAENPDLIFIAFGMNEATSSTSFRTNIQLILDSIASSSPSAEVVLVSACTPNDACSSFTSNKLDTQEQIMYSLAEENSVLKIAVAPVNSMCRQMLTMGKKATDGLNNNLNHPNDFIVRLYAQTILAVLS